MTSPGRTEMENGIAEMISEYAEVEVDRYGGRDMVAGPPERLETTLAGEVEEY